MNLGFMLYDVFDLSKPGTCNAYPAISLFQAKIQNGVLMVPTYESRDVIKTMREDI